MSLTFSIIGTGKLGSNLCAAFQKSGYHIVSVWNRSGNRAVALVNQLKLDAVCGNWPDYTEDLGDVIFLCVPDDQIEPAIHKLSGEMELSGKYIVHTSGAHPGDILNPAKQAGAFVAAFHPLQSFTEEPHPGIFHGCWISIQGDEKAVSLLESVAQKLGAKPKVVSAEEKRQLHVAAVFAGNYLVTLLEQAQQCVSNPELKSKIPSMFHALMEQVLNNVKTQGVDRALTGPLSRGDDSTIVNHLEDLAHNPDLLQMYKVLGRATLPIVNRSERITSDKLKTMQNLLE